MKLGSGLQGFTIVPLFFFIWWLVSVKFMKTVPSDWQWSRQVDWSVYKTLQSPQSVWSLQMMIMSIFCNIAKIAQSQILQYFGNIVTILVQSAGFAATKMQNKQQNRYRSNIAKYWQYFEKKQQNKRSCGDIGNIRKYWQYCRNQTPPKCIWRFFTENEKVPRKWKWFSNDQN